MKYTNKVTHLMENGIEQVNAAILYHAEAEWSGRAYMLMQKPAKVLYDAQLNYDFLPIDAIMEQAQVKNGALCLSLIHILLFYHMSKPVFRFATRALSYFC